MVRHCRRSSRVLLSFEDEDEKWHKIDEDHSLDDIKPGFEGTFDSKVVKYKVIGVPREGEGAVMMYGDESDYHIEDGVHFPTIPPPSPESHLPMLVSNTKVKLIANDCVSLRILFALVMPYSSPSLYAHQRHSH